MSLPVRDRIFVLLLAVSLIAGKECCAAGDYPSGSVGSFALAGCIDLRRSSPLDLMQNPSLSFDRRLNIDLSLARLYEISELNLASGMVAVNIGRTTIAAGMTQLDYGGVYWEREYAIVASKAFGTRLRCGISARYFRLEFAGGYSGLDLLALDAGMLWQIRSSLIGTAFIKNFNRPSFESGLSKLPVEGSLGISAEVTAVFSFHVKFNYHEKLKDRLLIGQKIMVHRDFVLSFGVGTEPTELSGGASFRIRGIQFDYAYRDNVHLGGTHQVGMRYSR